MKRKTDFYSKYIVKTPFVLVILFLTEIILFIYLTNSTIIESITSYTGYFDDNKVVINEIIEETPDNIVYVFKKKDEKIYKLEISKIETVDYSTILSFGDLSQNNIELNGNVTIEMVSEHNSLLSIILGNKMKYMPND